MDNFDSSKLSPDEDLNKPIPFDDDDTGKASVSHSPLDLAGGGTAKAPKVGPIAQPAITVEKKTTEKIVSSDRITGIKTFFTKLQAGSISFLDEQITNWLKNNPGVTIKKTSTVTGMLAGKTTETNIIVTIWY